MILKKIMHFFCGRSLEKETAKTNALIREAEQYEKAAVERLTAQTDKYRAQAVEYKQKSDAELNKYIQFMNKQLGLAEKYVLPLGDFQDKIFLCFDSWVNKSIVEQKIQLHYERITTKYKMLDFIAALQVELNKLTQRDERNEWRHMIKNRPILVGSPFIERTVRQVNSHQKSSSESMRNDLSRLKSYSMMLQTELKELRHEYDRLTEASKEIIEKHKAHKAELNDLYRKCSEIFNEIRDHFSDHFGSAPTESPLANSWITEIDGTVTIPKLISTHRGTADIQREVQQEFNALNNDFHEIRSKIESNRTSGDFSTFNEDKATRDRLFTERKEVGERREEITVARKVLYSRVGELKEMLAKFDSLQPDESIRRIVEIFHMDKDFDVRLALGVSTREDRRKQYELKNQRK